LVSFYSHIQQKENKKKKKIVNFKDFVTHLNFFFALFFPLQQQKKRFFFFFFFFSRFLLKRDINRIFVNWDKTADSLTFAIDCFGVCGDADGDGNPDRASAALAGLGGDDLPDLARGEAVAIALDFNLDAAGVIAGGAASGPFDFVLGVPGGEPANAEAAPAPGGVSTLACARGQVNNDLYNMARCAGIYEYQDTSAVPLGRRFLRPLELNGQPWPFVNHNPTPSQAQPDLEFTVGQLTQLRSRGLSPANADGSWRFDLQAFAGSFLDAGIGEDYFPSNSDVRRVEFPCSIRDACDVCGGSGNTCLDCAGLVNGPNRYDDCDVCGGDSRSCADCQGMPNGRAVYDLCDVCNGDASTCVDCAGVVGGQARYDACDVCAGDNASCADCAGKPNGSSVYDDCDVCDGDGTTCCGAGGKECCVNYCGVPDAYWDFLLLPVTIDDIIDKLRFANEVFMWLCDALPPYETVGPRGRDLYFGRMAEFNRVFLEECLEDFCQASGTLYTRLVDDNANPSC
jgi:hypothetical protein